MKRRARVAIPDVCMAVKQVRLAFADSQERFAQRLHVAVMTVSRFELGKKVPRDPDILRRLQSLAAEKDLTEEAALFETAFEQAAQRHGSSVLTFSVPELACSMMLDVINEDLIRPRDALSRGEDDQLRKTLAEFWYALKQEQGAGWPGTPQRMTTAAQALDSIRKIRIDVLRRVTQDSSADEDFNVLNHVEQEIKTAIEHDTPVTPEHILAILQAAKRDRIRKAVLETAELTGTSTSQAAVSEGPGLPQPNRNQETLTVVPIREKAPRRSKARPKVKEQGIKQR